jgi:hypothetical protein
MWRDPAAFYLSPQNDSAAMIERDRHWWIHLIGTSSPVAWVGGTHVHCLF